MDVVFNVRSEVLNIFIAALTLMTSLALNEAIKDTLNIIPMTTYQLLSKWIYATIVISILIIILMFRSYVYRVTGKNHHEMDL